MSKRKEKMTEGENKILLLSKAKCKEDTQTNQLAVQEVAKPKFQTIIEIQAENIVIVYISVFIVQV